MFFPAGFTACGDSNIPKSKFVAGVGKEFFDSFQYVSNPEVDHISNVFDRSNGDTNPNKYVDSLAITYEYPLTIFKATRSVEDRSLFHVSWMSPPTTLIDSFGHSRE